MPAQALFSRRLSTEFLVPTMQSVSKKYGKTPLKTKYGKFLQIILVYCAVFLRTFFYSVRNQHKDKEGRLLCIEAKLNDVLVLCNIYAPNKEEPEFFHELNFFFFNIGQPRRICYTWR